MSTGEIESSPVVESSPTTSIPRWMSREQVEFTLNFLDLKYVEQSGFMKVEQPGGRVYIANTKTIRRVDISGFEIPNSLGVVPHCGPFGKVKQQLRLGESCDEALGNLKTLLDILKSLPPPAPVVKEKKAPKKEKKTKISKVEEAPVQTSSSESEEAKAREIELIKEYSLKTGVPISKNSIAYSQEV